MSTFKRGWYLIYTRPNHERKIHTRLTEMNIQSFLPLKKKLQVRRDRKRYVEAPLFPSYVFTYLADFKNYYNAIEMEGCLYYVRSGKEIARVNESIINNIRMTITHAMDYEISESRFQPGRKVLVTEGPLTGLVCEVVRSDNKEKLLVRVNLIRRNILVNLPKGNIVDMEKS